MPLVIRNVCETDLDAVLGLNQSEVPHVGSIDLERLRWFADNADYFRVAENDGIMAGYLIGLRPGTSYASPNYRWFCDRYSDFAYIDRVAVDARSRRAGLASRLYDDLAASMPRSVAQLACEVNVRPPNETSMLFHERQGFRKVGSLVSGDGDKEVALLLKQLRQ